ncbi:LysM domain-containingprotein [Pleurostoma richardsiae]|uniref:LysM domain-containingprotein n=1 Tax=Pleurostoma richardsiae TaxID=41990 RepID=A0AA38VIL1_9PEZI|nr:LysM domain-containingprotein [Pleurostoma richardsiae]
MFLPAIAAATKLKLQNPRFNTWKFPPATGRVNDAYGRNTSLPVIGRRSTRQSDVPQGGNNSSAATSRDYMIAPELAEAARIVAESSPIAGAGGSYVAKAAELKARFWNQTTRSGGNGLHSRAASSFWMENVEMNGYAPYAGSDYVVFRNVMDYGAKGDGLTDDTAAINRAITDGNRCGQACGSSTAYPAVIYFPSGTYLLTDSLIQYYNTQLLGNPINRPTLLAAPSFVGYAAILTDVYIPGANGSEWYIPQNNFMRSVRNFVIDITTSPADNYVCGIHWQVAQATDLQKIDFYMKDGTTQQGVYMENGSGGFLTDLYFQGGNFGAYMGNQQFTTRNLIFNGCLTAVQVFWDWAWTMQGINVLGPGSGTGTGLVIVDGAGGPGSTGQGLGSLVLLDSGFFDLEVGVSTTVAASNSSSFLIQNCKFDGVTTSIQDTGAGKVLLAGSAGEIPIDSWGFGNIITGESGSATFQNGNYIPAAHRSTNLLAPSSSSSRGSTQPGSFFSRSAPTYDDQSVSAFVNVKAMGARGDGVSDDAAILNQILASASNASQIVFFPYGVYAVSDTLNVPVGSRIVGQAWPAIVGTGDKFQDMANPRVVLQVGHSGSVGVIEISDMLVSVKGPAAGGQLSVFGDDTKSRVHCGVFAPAHDIWIVGYLENVWAWTADHDIDTPEQNQISGTASEHAVLYQYQLSQAKDIFLSMIQTESPYFQPTPRAPAPFTPGMFPNDPTFADCSPSSVGCAISWALRILDSSTVYIYSSGLYSWFQSYSQTCVPTENCQVRAVDIQKSSDIWMYDLCTKAVVEMVTPLNSTATFGANNQTGYLASVLAWLEGSSTVVGNRFAGWPIFANGSLAGSGLSVACEAALYQTVKCDDSARNLLSADAYIGSTGNETLTTLLCDPGCDSSIAYLRGSVSAACAATPDLTTGVSFVSLVDRLWSNWNQSCFTDPSTGQNCNDDIAGYPVVAGIDQLPHANLCSYCYTQKLRLMQQSAYSSAYDNSSFASRYQYVASSCGISIGSFEPATSLIAPAVNKPAPVCVSGNTYVTKAGDTCDSIARANMVSSATLFSINPNIFDCSSIPAATSLCLPQQCDALWEVGPNNDCLGIVNATGTSLASLIEYNSMLDWNCSTLHAADDGTGPPSWGKILCVSTPGGTYSGKPAHNVSADGNWDGGSGYGTTEADAPGGAAVAPGTTTKCASWYVYDGSMLCVQICLANSIPFSLFTDVNPSLGNTTCDANLVLGDAYCVAPLQEWNDTSPLSTITFASSPPTAAPSTTSSLLMGSSASSSSAAVATTVTAIGTLSSSSSASTSTSTSTPSGLPYLGCWIEPSNVRALTGLETVDYAAMTHEMCHDFCVPAGYGLYGVEYGGECYCGNSLSSGTFQTVDDDCSMPCPGDSGEQCGAGSRISLFGDANDLPSAVSPGQGPEATYVGCYTEATDARALASASYVDSAIMTVEVCEKFCFVTNTYSMAGIEYGGECYCGDTLQPGSVAAPETDCNMACGGNRTELCGAGNRLSVYQVVA